MKRGVRGICILLFLLLCAGVFAFLHRFTVSEGSVQYALWDSCELVCLDGTRTAFTESDALPPIESEGAYYQFSVRLPEDFTDSALVFEASGMESILLLSDTEIYRSSMLLPEGEPSMGRVEVPLPDDAAGCKVTLRCRPLNTTALLPPVLRIYDSAKAGAENIAYANITGIPAGAFGLTFILVSGLFLLSIARRTPDWSLLPLCLAAAGLTGHQISISCGYFFLSGPLNNMLVWSGWDLLILLLLVAFFAMNRQRSFWRYLKWAAIWSGGALLLLYLISLLRGSYLSRYINGEIEALFRSGAYGGLLYWLTVFLVIASALISCYALMRSIAQSQADMHAMALREQLALEGYQAMERRLHHDAKLRHETGHRLAALSALYHKGDFDELGRQLAEFTRGSTQSHYTENFLINAILQNAEAQAADAGVHFEAIALVPKELPIPESDLCSFMMNLLDNAFEANLAVKEERFIRFRAELSGNFLAVRCENAYSGFLKLDENDFPKTTKDNAEVHGFGLRQMREIADKYDSILDITHTGKVFIVQTALCISHQ